MTTTPGSGGNRIARSSSGAGGGRRSSAGGAQRNGSTNGEWEDSNLLYETTRLRNELRSKDRELEEKLVEVRTLKGAMLTKDKALERAEAQLADTKDRLLGMEGDMLSLRKSLAKAEAERDVYRQEVAKASREADRMNEVMALIPRDSGASQEVSRLEQRLAEVRAESQALADDNKACYNVIRAKEKEIARQSKKLAAAEEAVLSKKELENVIADLRRQLGQAQADNSMLQRMQRLKDAEVADIQRDAGKAAKELATTSEYLAAVTAELQLAKAALNEAKAENTVLRDELARVSAVASRVVRAEYRGGSKDEGAIPVLMHLEEIKFMQGEIHRLKQKLEHAERSAHSAQQQKERLYKRIDALAANAEGLARVASLGEEASPAAAAAADAPGAGVEDGEEEEGEISLESPAEVIRELRAEVADLRGAVGMKGEEAALLAQQLEDRAARLDATRGEMVKLKGRLCEIMGDDAYMAEFGEAAPPPAVEDEAAAGEETAATEAQQAEAAAQVAQQAEVAAELQKALQELAEREEAAAELQQQLEEAQAAAEAAQEERQQAQAAAEEAGAAREELQRKLHVAEATADAASGEADALQEQLEAAEARAAELQAEVEELREQRSAAGGSSTGGAAAAGALASGAAVAAAAGAAAPAGDALSAGSAAIAGRGLEDAVGDAVAGSAGQQQQQDGEGLGIVGSPSHVERLRLELHVKEREAEELRAQLCAAGATPRASPRNDSGSDAAAAAEDEDEDSAVDHSPEADTAGVAAAAAGSAHSCRSAGGSGGGPAGIVSPDALAEMVERLVARREAERREGAARNDGALFDEMTAALRGEMARLGKELVDKEAEAERLRSEVGSLATAKLSAEAMAARLDEMNELSMRVAALKMELSKQEAEHVEREGTMLAELAHLRGKLAAKKKSPTKMLKKTLTQAAKGFRESLSSHGGGHDGERSPIQLPFNLSKRRDSARGSIVDEHVLPP